YRVPYGMITGHIEYEGGISVRDCNVAVESSSGVNTNKSVYLDGDRDYYVFLDNDNDAATAAAMTNITGQHYTKQADLDFMMGTNDRTIEFWFNAEEFGKDFVFAIG